MKKVIIYLLILMTLNINAQSELGRDRGSDIGRKNLSAERLKGTTLVVLLDNEMPVISDKLKSSMSKYWKHTKYEFANTDQMNTYLKDDKYSVLGIFRHVREDDKKRVLEYSFSILLGNKKNKEVNDAEIVASVSLPDTWAKGVGSMIIEYDYLIPFFIKHLNTTVGEYLNKEANEINRKGNAYYYNNGKEKLIGKTILINEKGTGKSFNIKQFCKNFSLKKDQVKMVSKEEIEKAIEREDDSIAFVYDMTLTGKIFDAKTTKTLAYGTGINILKRRLLSLCLPLAVIAIIIISL